VQADICRPDEIRRMFQQVRSEFGGLDIFVSNARTEAPTFYEAPMEISLEKWDTAVDSQAKAFLVAVREAALLLSDGGRIVAIPLLPVDAPAAGSPGWLWAQRKPQWSRWSATLQLLWQAAASP